MLENFFFIILPYLDELENIAIKIRETKNIKFDHYLIGGIERKLRDLLIQDYQIKIKIESQGVDNNFVRSYNKKTKTLLDLFTAYVHDFKLKIIQNQAKLIHKFI